MAAQGQGAVACPLLLLSDDVLEVVGHQISDALRPAVAGALAACNQNLWRVMRAPLAKLQPRHAAARALAGKVGSSCAELSEATRLRWNDKGLDAADMATLAMLFSTGALAWVERLLLGGNRFGPAGASALLSELGCGDAPRLKHLNLGSNGLGIAGASALAGALSRGALPKLKVLRIDRNGLGNEELTALATPLRRHSAVELLDFEHNRISDSGLSALVDNLGEKELKQLEVLALSNNHVGDAGCATLTAALEGGSLPLVTSCQVMNNPASIAAQRAVRDALAAHHVRRGRAVRTTIQVLELGGYWVFD